MLEDFEKVYPERLDDRLLWFEDCLGISKTRLLQMTLMNSEAQRYFRDASWSVIIGRSHVACNKIEELLFSIIKNHYDFDYERMAADPRKFDIILSRMSNHSWWNSIFWGLNWRWLGR